MRHTPCHKNPVCSFVLAGEEQEPAANKVRGMYPIPPAVLPSQREGAFLKAPRAANSSKSILIRQLAYGGGAANGEFDRLEHVLSGNPVSTFRDYAPGHDPIRLDHGLDSMF